MEWCWQGWGRWRAGGRSGTAGREPEAACVTILLAQRGAGSGAGFSWPCPCCVPALQGTGRRLPRQRPGAAGCSLPGPALCRPARWVPASGPGTGDAALVSLVGAGTDSELFSHLCPCPPPAPSSLHEPTAFVPGGPRQCCIFPRQEHPSVCQPCTSAVQTPNQHPKTDMTPHCCVLSHFWKQPRWTHHGICFQQERPCPSGQWQSDARAAGGMRVLPWDWAQLLGSTRCLAAPAGFRLLVERSSARRPAPSEPSRCAAWRQKYFPSCCPPGAWDKFRKQQ